MAETKEKPFKFPINETKEKFFKFLKKHKSLTKFKNNLRGRFAGNIRDPQQIEYINIKEIENITFKEAEKRFYITTPYRDLIMNAFLWSDTEENELWNDLDHLWYEECEND